MGFKKTRTFIADPPAYIHAGPTPATAAGEQAGNSAGWQGQALIPLAGDRGAPPSRSRPISDRSYDLLVEKNLSGFFDVKSRRAGVSPGRETAVP